MEGDGVVINAEFSLVGSMGMNAGEELDQRGFTGAVFAAQRVDFAGAEVEGDSAQRGDAGEFFGQAPCFEERLVE
jgi:hypothetical protein